MTPALDPKQGYIQICIAYDVSLIMLLIVFITRIIISSIMLIVLTVLIMLIVIAPRVPPTLFRMFSVSVELHWVSISLALPLSLLRRARVEPPGISEDLAKQ